MSSVDTVPARKAENPGFQLHKDVSVAVHAYNPNAWEGEEKE